MSNWTYSIGHNEKYSCGFHLDDQ